jgi:hypothetical protein
MLTMKDGGWTAQTLDGRRFDLTDAELARRGWAIDVNYGEEGFYALMDGFRVHSTYGYRHDAQAGIVHLENGDIPVWQDEFMTSAVRIDDEGLPICSFCEPAESQLTACMRNPKAAMHLAEIVDGRLTFGSALVSDWVEAAHFRHLAEAGGDELYQAWVA